MNPITNMRNLNKMNDRELEMGLAGTAQSWHNEYKDSAWIFVGGLPYDLTEGDTICVFSQFGEIVHINLVRDLNTGKSKGFAFICYEDQRSTILAVDNFNGMKLIGRLVRVDHVHTYKLPKDLEKMDADRRKLFLEGVAPKPINQEEQINASGDENVFLQEDGESRKKKKKNKDERKKKRKKEKKSKFKRKSRSSPSDSSSADSSEESVNEHTSIRKGHSHKKHRKSHKERSSSPECEDSSYQTLGSRDKKRNDKYEQGDTSRGRSTHERNSTNYASYKSRNRSRSRSPRHSDFERRRQRRDENSY